MSWNILDLARKILSGADSDKKDKGQRTPPRPRSPPQAQASTSTPTATPQTPPYRKVRTPTESSTKKQGDDALEFPQSRTQISEPLVSAPAVGNIFIDLARNAEDNVSPQGRTFRGLRFQLTRLQRKYSKSLFVGVNDQDILAAYQEAFFPSGIPQTYLLSNVSLKEGSPYLAIRPRIIGPRLEQLLPRGITIALRGRLSDNQKDPNNSVFQPQNIVEMSHFDARPFEREVTAFAVTQSDSIYPASRRQRNILAKELVDELAPISIRTKERLQDWRNYLDWRDRLIKANMNGIRFVKADFIHGGSFRFLVVTESKEAFESDKRILRSNELRAFGLGYSKDPWAFEYNEDQREKTFELGDFVRHEECSQPRDVDFTGIAWEKPYFANVHFRLSDDHQNELDSLIAYGSNEEISRNFQGRLPTDGFLALSVIGDISLIGRQRRELDQLQEQSGYAPFLSSYLFDIKEARSPKALEDISDEQWTQPGLNDDQKLSVRKMISAPDLALIQGPPGTGKTTMIAEATRQLLNQNKKVLLVSQANLAVDNALERLELSPAVRAIRLGRKGDRENVFSRERALETYYSSISKMCRSRTLDVWDKADALNRTLTQWLSTFDLAVNDVDNSRRSETKLGEELSACQQELELENQRATRSAQESALREAAESFIDMLEQPDHGSGAVPEHILSEFFERVAGPMADLIAIGIRVNRVWPTAEYGSLLEKASFATEIMRSWKDLCEAIPHLKGDAERLTISESELVISSEDVLEQSNLERQKRKLLECLVNGDDVASEFRTVENQLREIKRRGSGLDRAMYERLFSVENADGAYHRKFTDPSTPRTQVLSDLNTALDTIANVRHRVQAGVATVCASVQGYLDSNPIQQPDQSSLRRLEGRVRDFESRMNEVIEQRRNRESTLQELIAQRVKEDKLPGDWSIGNYPVMRKLVVDYIQSIAAQTEQTRSLRQEWEQILRDWVADLAKAETLRADQINFLDIYISSCNVVGVTCTENRRTLEEAGHSKFDVVIVDEVSKATPPEIIMPLMMGQTAILVGDHRQLPPLFKEHEGSWEEAVAAREESDDAGEEDDSGSELTLENFERFRSMVTSSLFKEHFENAPGNLKAFLFTQYRMHPQIMRAVNQFYENRLECGLSDPDGLDPNSDPRGHRLHRLTLSGPQALPYLTPERHAVWVDSMYDPQRQRHYETKDGSSGTCNDLEALLIAKMLIDIEMACREQGYGASGKQQKHVGVVTFYNKQKTVIRRAVKNALKQSGIEFTAIRQDVNTVDRYQGQERSIILVSMVRNPSRKLSARANTAQFERINVAFSRAQELLIVVGAKDVFCSYPVQLPFLDRPGSSRVEVYRYIIDEMQRYGGLLQSDQIISTAEYQKLLVHQDGRVQRR